MSKLADTFGRHFQYLRLSVTDACNFRCTYCLPNGYKKPPSMEFLTLREIDNLVGAFAELGFWKFRLTGGEPTLRRDIVDIVSCINRNPTVSEIAISTNGYRLESLAPAFKTAGVTALNVSVDSLDAERFRTATGQDLKNKVMAGIEKALELGLRVKVNAVLFKETWEQELPLFLEWIKHVPVSVRFIELMRIGQNKELFTKQFVSAAVLQDRFEELGWNEATRAQGAGPAKEFTHPEFEGKLGIIAPYAKNFCASCNRLRVSSRGALQLCLFGEKDYSLRHLLQDVSQRKELIATIESLMIRKPESHFLNEDNYGFTETLSQIGG